MTEFDVFALDGSYVGRFPFEAAWRTMHAGCALKAVNPERS